MEQRGCSPVNPYGDRDTCGYIEEDATLPTKRRKRQLTIGVDNDNDNDNTTTAVDHIRAKRGITIDYHGYVCYCRDPEGECNSSNLVISSLVTSMFFVIISCAMFA